ncbi:hypothetical protein, partial [Desulfotruncus alcoholivorax]|uniref:hypothetical protein n=1 Tax=Desulfotruncus alcoholivorax TaxID=265477 RepID=UPI001A99CC47
PAIVGLKFTFKWEYEFFEIVLLFQFTEHILPPGARFLHYLTHFPCILIRQICSQILEIIGFFFRSASPM